MTADNLASREEKVGGAGEAAKRMAVSDVEQYFFSARSKLEDLVGCGRFFYPSPMLGV